MDELPPSIVLLSSSAFGSATYALLRRNSVWYGWLANFVIGTASGFLFAPIICNWQGWVDTHAQPACGFTLGLVGVIMCRSIVDAAENDGTKTFIMWLKGWLRKTFGLPPSNGE